MLTTILLIAGSVLSGAVLALKVIAPLTKNTVDDKILIYAEDVEKVLEGLGTNKLPDTVVIAPTPKA